MALVEYAAQIGIEKFAKAGNNFVNKIDRTEFQQNQPIMNKFLTYLLAQIEKKK